MEHTSRRSFLARLSALALAARTRSWAAEPRALIFAGTYTKDKGSTSQGIYAFRWDADSGTLEPLGLAGAAVNPSFLALSPDRRHLYAVNEVDEYLGREERFSHVLCRRGCFRQAEHDQYRLLLREPDPAKSPSTSPAKRFLSPTMTGAAPHPSGCCRAEHSAKLFPSSSTAVTAPTRSAKPRLIPTAQPYLLTIDMC